MAKLSLWIIIFVSITSFAERRVRQATNIESAISTFINSSEVATWLQADFHTKNDSAVLFIDINSVIKHPFAKTWMGYKISFVDDKLLLDSLKHFEPHFLFKGRPEYFVIIAREESRQIIAVTVLHAYSNRAAEAKIIQKQKSYIVTKKRLTVF